MAEMRALVDDEALDLMELRGVSFFEDAAKHVEERVASETDPVKRVVAYLEAVAAALRPAAPAFMEDVAAFPPAREVYELNTRIAARRVRELIEDGVDAGVFRDVPSVFISEAVATVMVAIQRREFSKTAGLGDAEAYAELAKLLLNGIRTAVA